MFRRQLSPSARAGAFTLIELLVVIGIIATLAALLLPALAGAQQKGKRVNEINAARQLILAWTLYADDHNGAVLPGYPAKTEAFDDQGNPVPDPPRRRYPWRLAPQLANSFRAIYVNESCVYLEEAAAMSHAQYVYRASLYPSLGYNTVFLGGDDNTFSPELAVISGIGNAWLTARVTQISRPSDLMAFASARARSERGHEPGYYQVHPPYLRTRQWEPAFNFNSPPNQFGYVHPRWNGRAVTVMTDGHAELLKETQLQDMRYWCNAATQADWTVQPLQ